MYNIFETTVNIIFFLYFNFFMSHICRCRESCRCFFTDLRGEQYDFYCFDDNSLSNGLWQMIRYIVPYETIIFTYRH